MNFNILGLLSQFLNNRQQINNVNIETQNTNCFNTPLNSTNSSDYPDVFFTQSTKITAMQNTRQSSNNQEINNNVNNNTTPFGSFNLNSISNIMPLLFNKSAPSNESGDMLAMLKNFSPEISQILSIFSKKNKHKESTKVEVQNQNIIDLSDYTEVP